MGDGVLTLQTPKMISGGTLWKAIGIARRNVQGIKDTEPVFEIRDLSANTSSKGWTRQQSQPISSAPPNLCLA